MPCLLKDDMVNIAAQYFAPYIHDNWSRYLAREQNSSSVNIVLIFISICYISSGYRLATVLPWWRLEHVVQDMKQDLQKVLLFCLWYLLLPLPHWASVERLEGAYSLPIGGVGWTRRRGRMLDYCKKYSGRNRWDTVWCHCMDRCFILTALIAIQSSGNSVSDLLGTLWTRHHNNWHGTIVREA